MVLSTTIFAQRVQAFVAANIDQQPKPGDGPRSQAVQAWQAKLIANGYHSPHDTERLRRLWR